MKLGCQKVKEQCICIRLLLQIGKIGAEIFQMLAFAIREEAMRQIVVSDSSAESRNGMTSVKGAEYSGCLPTGSMCSNVEHLMGFVMKLFVILATSWLMS